MWAVLVAGLALALVATAALAARAAARRRGAPTLPRWWRRLALAAIPAGDAARRARAGYVSVSAHDDAAGPGTELVELGGARDDDDGAGEHALDGGGPARAAAASPPPPSLAFSAAARRRLAELDARPR